MADGRHILGRRPSDLDGIRTRVLLLDRELLHQLSYEAKARPEPGSCARPGRTWLRDWSRWRGSNPRWTLCRRPPPPGDNDGRQPPPVAHGPRMPPRGELVGPDEMGGVEPPGCLAEGRRFERPGRPCHRLSRPGDRHSVGTFQDRCRRLMGRSSLREPAVCARALHLAEAEGFEPPRAEALPISSRAP